MKNSLIKLLININDKLIELISRSIKNNLKTPSKSNYYAETQNLVKKFKKITLFDFWKEFVDGPQAPHYNIPFKGHKLSKFPADMFIYHPREEKYKPNRAIARILNEFPNFELFREYEKFIFSTVLMGILQRKI